MEMNHCSDFLCVYCCSLCSKWYFQGLFVASMRNFCNLAMLLIRQRDGESIPLLNVNFAVF